MLASFEAELKALREQQKLARPLPARFQAATDKVFKFKLQKEELVGQVQALQEQGGAAAKALQEKLEGVAKEAAENEAKLSEAEQELAAVKADLAAEGPCQGQRSPEANAAVEICGGLLQQTGMSEEATAKFMDALRCALSTALARTSAPVVSSPFAAIVGVAAAGASASAAGVARGGLFAPGGSFPSQGGSPFPGSPTQEELAEAAKQEAVKWETQRQEWEQGRSEAVASLKHRLEVQRLKHGTAASLCVAAQEIAERAQEAGGGAEEIKQAEKLALDVLSEQNLIDSMEGQRQSLESEAFSKAAAHKSGRGSPF